MSARLQTIGGRLGRWMMLGGPLWALPAPAHAAPADRPAILTLRLNEIDQGDVIVLLRGTDVLIPPEALEKAGIRAPQGRQEAVHGRPYLSLASISPPVTFEVDPYGALLRLAVPPEFLAESVINLQAGAPPDIDYRQDTSAFLNYAPRLVDGEAFDAFVESGVSAAGGLLYSGASVTTERRFVRGLSNLTYDDRPRLHRWQLGDAFSSTGPLGSNALIGGLTFARTFELDPYHSGAPGLNYSGSVTTPATVDVYVNDTLVGSRPIPAGTFRLENIPIEAGAGETHYVVRDVFGNQQHFSAAYYHARGALAAGEQEFSYSAGAARLGYGTESFHYQRRPALLARHRLGLTPWLTAGWAGEGDTQLVSGGPTLELTAPFGSFDLAGGVSAARPGEGNAANGVAGFLGYSYVGRRLALNAFVRGTADRFANLALRPEDDRPVFDTTLGLSVSLTRAATASAQQGYVVTRDQGTSMNSTVSLGVQLGETGNLTFTGVRSDAETALRPIYEAFATFSLGLGARMSASLGGHLIDDGRSLIDDHRKEAIGSINRSLPIDTGVGFDVSGAVGDTARLNATGQAQASFGRVQATYYRVEGEGHTILEPSGGIVYVAGGGLFLTRPVQQGYAVVEVPNSEGIRVMLNNQVVGTTDADGFALVPNLLPYYGNRLSIDDSDLPLDRTIQATELSVAPSPRAGALVRLEVERARYVRGKVLMVAPDGTTTVPRYGEVTVRSGENVAMSPVGGGGEIELDGLPPGRYRSVLSDPTGRRCTFEFDAPATDDPILEVGLLRCTERLSAAQVAAVPSERSAPEVSITTEERAERLRRRLREEQAARDALRPPIAATPPSVAATSAAMAATPPAMAAKPPAMAPKPPARPAPGAGTARKVSRRPAVAAAVAPRPAPPPGGTPESAAPRPTIQVIATVVQAEPRLSRALPKLVQRAAASAVSAVTQRVEGVRSLFSSYQTWLDAQRRVRPRARPKKRGPR